MSTASVRTLEKRLEWLEDRNKTLEDLNKMYEISCIKLKIEVLELKRDNLTREIESWKKILADETADAKPNITLLKPEPAED